MVSQFHRYLFSLKNRFTSPAKVIAGRGFSNNLKGGSSIFMKLLQELPGGYDSLSRENARQAGDMSVRPLNQIELESYLRTWLGSIGIETGTMNLAEMQHEMRNISEFLNEIKAHYHIGNFSDDDIPYIRTLIREGTETQARLQRRIDALSAQLKQYVDLMNDLQAQLTSSINSDQVNKIQSEILRLQRSQAELEGHRDETELHYKDVKLDTLDEDIKAYIVAILGKLKVRSPESYMQNTLLHFLSTVDRALASRPGMVESDEFEESLQIFKRQLEEYLKLLQTNPSAADVTTILNTQFLRTGNEQINNLMVEIARVITSIIKTKQEVLPDTARLRQMLQERMFIAPENDADLAAYICDKVLEKYDAQKQKIDELQAQIQDLSEQVVQKQTKIESLEGENMAFRSAMVRWINQLSTAKDVHEQMSWATLIDRMNGLVSQMDTQTKIMSETSSAQSGGEPEPSVREAIAMFMQQIIAAFQNYADGIATLSDPATTVAAGTTKAGMAKQLSRNLYDDIRGIQNLPGVVPLVKLYPSFGKDLSLWLEQIQGIVENYNSMLDKSVNFYSVIEKIAAILNQPVTTNMDPIIDGVRELSKGSNELFKAQMQQLRASLAQLQQENEALNSSLSAYTSMGTIQKIQEDLNRNVQYQSRFEEMAKEISDLQSKLKSAESTVQRLTPSSSSIPPVPPPTPLNSSIYSESTIGPPPSEPPSSYSIPSVPSVPSVPPSASSEMGDAEIAPGYKKDISLGVQALSQNTGLGFLDDLYELRALMADIYASPKISPLEKAQLADYLNVEIVRVLLYPKGIWPFSPDNRLQTRRYYIMLPILSRVGLAAAFKYMKEHPKDKLTQDLYEGYGKVILGALKRVNFSLTALSRIPFNDALYSDPTTIFTIYNKQVDKEAADSKDISLGPGALTTRGSTLDELRRVFNVIYAGELQHPKFNLDLMDWIRTLIFWCKQKMRSTEFWDPKYLPFVIESCDKIEQATLSVLQKPDNVEVLVRNVLNPFEVNKKKIPYGFFSPKYWDPSYETIADYYKI